MAWNTIHSPVSLALGCSLENVFSLSNLNVTPSYYASLTPQYLLSFLHSLSHFLSPFLSFILLYHPYLFYFPTFLSLLKKKSKHLIILSPFASYPPSLHIHLCCCSLTLFLRKGKKGSHSISLPHLPCLIFLYSFSLFLSLSFFFISLFSIYPHFSCLKNI